MTPIDVSCPRCGAAVGEPCFYKHPSRTGSTTHRERVKAAAARPKPKQPKQQEPRRVPALTDDRLYLVSLACGHRVYHLAGEVMSCWRCDESPK